MSWQQAMTTDALVYTQQSSLNEFPVSVDILEKKIPWGINYASEGTPSCS